MANPTPPITALSRRVSANGLDHHVLEWIVPDANATAVLLHGFLDTAASWDLVVPHLTAAGFRVIAPDLRGYGESPRTPKGSYYHFFDYIADIAGILAAVAADSPVYLIGHSMGGIVATLYGGAFPERIAKLAVLEGIGTPNSPVSEVPARVRRWIERVNAVLLNTDTASLALSEDEALRRLILNHPGIDRAILRSRIKPLTRRVGDDRVAWLFDPLHRTPSPTLFVAEHYKAFAARVTCPALYVSGGTAGYSLVDEDDRLAAFRSLDRAVLVNAGHMMHWTQPAQLAELLAGFWQPS